MNTPRSTSGAEATRAHARSRWPKPALLLLALSVVGIPLAPAATFSVTTTADSGGGSLRNAMADANATPGDDIIVFDPTVFASPQTIIATGGPLPAISDNLTFAPPAAQVTIESIFQISDNVTVTMENLAISPDTHTNRAVTNSGFLTMQRCVVQNGGGIASSKSLVLRDCTIRLNQWVAAGGGLWVRGIEGADISGCLFYNNTGSSGGGIWGGPLRIRNSTFTQNVADNKSIYGGAGGGIYCVDASEIDSCTIVSNTAKGIQGSFERGGGGLYAGPNTKLVNSIVAGNSSIMGGPGPDVYIAVDSTSHHNLIRNGSGMTGISNGSNGNLVGTANAPIDPQLGLTASNGGSTDNWTRVLLKESPAFNAGDPAFAPPPDYDQRGPGFPRVQGGRIDMGAYEVTLVDSLAVTTPADEDNATSDPSIGSGTSLREAINYANSHPGPDTITFATPIFSSTATITLGGTALPSITGETVIIGPVAPLIVSGNNQSRVFIVNAGALVTVENVTVSNGYASESGGGISNSGALTLRRCTLSTNSATDGGALQNTGSLTAESCTFSGNSTYPPLGSGAGIRNASTGLLTLTNCTFAGNSAPSSGGGVYNAGTLTVAHCTVSENTTTGDGGGIFSLVSFTLRNSIVAGNSAGANGADISGPVISTGSYNLIRNGTGMTGITHGSNGNIVGTAANPVNPLLDLLGNNGGPTKTMAPYDGSPAVNAGEPSYSGPLTTDQRGSGFPRVSEGRLDIGALEGHVQAPTDYLVVTTTVYENNGTIDPLVGAGTSLWEAINYANSRPRNAEITFDPGVFSSAKTISVVGNPLPAISGNTKILGPAATLTLSGYALFGGSTSVMVINSGTVTLDRLTFYGGKAGAAGGGIRNLVSGNLTVSRCTFEENSAPLGGGVANEGALTVSQSTFKSNHAPSGSGGAINNTGVMTVANCTFGSNDSNSGTGGALTTSGANASATLESCTIASNNASSAGGISVIGGAALTMRNTIVGLNTGGQSPDIVGAVLSASHYNLIGNGTGMTGISHGTNGNQVGTAQVPINPSIGSLVNNGGPTATRALQTGSPAINTGNPAYAGLWTTDQRGAGYRRVSGGRIDIGAFEVNLPTPYESWAVARGLSAGVNDGYNDDPNHDGTSNLAHFGFDTEPLGNGTHPGKSRTSISSVGGTDYLTLTLPVRNGATFAPNGSGQQTATTDGITYVFQATTSPMNFTLGGTSEVTPALSAGLPPAVSAGYSYRTFRMSTPSNASPSGFMRATVNSP